MQEQQRQGFLFHEGNYAERRSSDARRYESWDRMNYACRAQKTAQNYRAVSRVNDASKSPIRSPTPSPPGSPIRPPQNHYRSLSPASRTQAIARGQKELMEMVNNMPETCYELSLKDLVEHNHGDRRREDEKERNDMSSEADLLEREKRRSVCNDVVVRGGRVNGIGSGQDHLLKVAFPVSFGPKNKKKSAKVVKSKNDDSNSNSNGTATRSLTSGDVSPKPSTGNSNNSGVDKEWWKKRYSAAEAGGESDQSGGDQLSSSSNSGGSNSSSTSGSRSSSLTSRSNSNNTRHGSGGGGCWWFIGKTRGMDS